MQYGSKGLSLLAAVFTEAVADQVLVNSQARLPGSNRRLAMLLYKLSGFEDEVNFRAINPFSTAIIIPH